ncbi:TPA: hypothetical protein F8V10_01125 [Legionella pneumophila]|nr:hypothetical protein [Legionella pneumophila]HAT5916154.1 hypothetical protein [Legionella pneumophila]HAT7773748.1 hypothetical protein [Legionella pneumophila]HAT7825323.1 hypothetical protein [Legionella pneumophila]HAT7918660.1 hypothetical protein [Legionella pneumophila]
MSLNVLPRLIRLRDAPTYVGMDRHRFNKDVRPKLVEIPMGSQGIAFDRLDLDAWVDDYIQCSGRPAAVKGGSLEIWDEKERQGYKSVVASGVLTKRSSDDDFAKALVLTTSKRRKSISQGVSKR